MQMRFGTLITAAVLLTLCADTPVPHAGPAAKDGPRWTERFQPPPCAWSSRGKNEFFILEPGDRSTFEGHEGKTVVKLVITVLEDTKRVGGVETRIVEERETHDGKLVEVSRNYFAVCGPTNDVFYFGEDVDLYKDGKVTDHEGSWQAEKSGAHAGLFMPARVLLGARFYQEIAPGVAMDRIEILSDDEKLKTPAGEFNECLRTEETTPLEPGVKDYKIYARGVGMISDGGLLLTRHTTSGTAGD